MRQTKGYLVGILTSFMMSVLCIIAFWLILNTDLAALGNLTVFNISGDAFGMIVCTVIFISIFKDRLNNTNTVAFMVLLFLEEMLLFWDTVGWIYDGNPGMYLLNEFLNYCIYLIVLFIPYTFWLYLYEMYRGDDILEKVRWAMRAVAAAGVVMLACNLFTGMYFTIDPSTGVYTRSDTFYLSFVMPGIIGMVCSAAIVMHEKNLRRKIVFLGYVLVPLAAAAFQIFIYGTSLQYMAMLFMLVAMYANIYLGRSGDLLRYEAERTEQRAEVMVSQIQPHFLYNALTAIMNIKGNPPATRDAIAEFGHYMRKNLDSLAQVNPIPITREVDHVETYVDILKQKYAERLDVRFDVQDTGFFIPPLTIKIILEQAVKFNLRQSDAVVHMGISIREVEGDHVITIIDNNPSTDSQSFVRQTQEDITVLRNRLESMVGGRLENTVSPEGAITCIITVPAITEVPPWM